MRIYTFVDYRGLRWSTIEASKTQAYYQADLAYGHTNWHCILIVYPDKNGRIQFERTGL